MGVLRWLFLIVIWFVLIIVFIVIWFVLTLYDLYVIVVKDRVYVVDKMNVEC